MTLTGKYSQKPEAKDKHQPPHGAGQKRNILTSFPVDIQTENQDRVFPELEEEGLDLITTRAGTDIGVRDIQDTDAAVQ